MKLIHIKSLWEVVISGSYVKAAENLGLTQSAVSKNISALERSIGVSLLERHTRPPKLTVAGRKMMPHFAQIILSYERIVEASNDLKLANFYDEIADLNNNK